MSNSSSRKRKKTTADGQNQSQLQSQLQSAMEVEDLNKNDQYQIDSNSGNSNDAEDKEKSIASLCKGVFEKEIDENKKALFTLLGLEEDDDWNQEIVKKLIKFLEYLDLDKFEDVLNLYDYKEEDDFNQIIGKEFEVFQKQNPKIKSGILLQYKKLRNTLIKHTKNSTPTKSSFDKNQEEIENLLHGWIKRLPEDFHVKIWEGFQPGFPKQPGLTVPLDLTVYKQNNKNAKAPSMILYGLKDLSEKKYNFTNPEIAKHIESTAPKGPSCLFGVSGSGKTRSLYEFASRHYSMYFVASGSDKDLGSYDLYKVMKVCEHNFRANGNGTNEVYKYAQSLVYARLYVFSAVCNHLERIISPYEWLLLQLSPLAYGGTDIFAHVARKFRMLGSLNAAAILLTDCARSFSAPTFYMFVDEAQNLFDTCKNKFLSSDNESNRSLYTALIRNLSKISPKLVVQKNKRVLWCPVTAGTGIKHDDLKDEMESTVAKVEFANEEYNRVYSKLDPLKEEDVYAYLEKFMQLDKFDKRYVNHVCRWLKGRPRFAATFVQTLMMFEVNLNDDDKWNGVILNHINEFIRALCLPKDSEFPENWSTINFQRGYFYNRLESLQDVMFDACQANETIKRAVVDVMFSFKPAKIDSSAMIVENGLGYAEKVDNTDGRVDSIIFEPIVIQAAIQYFASNPRALQIVASDGLSYSIVDDLLRRVKNTISGASSGGFAIEKFVAFNLHCRCDEFLRQFKFLKGWSGEKTVGKLAFGSLAKECCANAAETMDWFTKIRNATEPGIVPPICLPDQNCGPDLIFFLIQTTDQGEERMPVLVQIKYTGKNLVKVAKDSIDPNQFYHNDKKPNGWDNHKKELFDDKAVLRIVLQFNADSNLQNKVEVDVNGGGQIVVDKSDTNMWEALFTKQNYDEMFL